MGNKLTVFIDTNVFLDFIERRPVGVKEAHAIFRLAANRCVDMQVSDLSIANIKYSTRKTIPLQDFYKIMKLSREFYSIVKDFAFADTVEVLEPHDFLSKYFPEEL